MLKLIVVDKPETWNFQLEDVEIISPEKLEYEKVTYFDDIFLFMEILHLQA